MRLQGQDAERGYAMAALLVSLAVMSVLMSVALPTWRHAAQREKEAELVFRGEQYARAVALFRAKNANAFPPSIDVLVQGKYLRKKYLDPITNKEFDVIGVGAQAGTSQPPGANGGRGARSGPTSGPGRGSQPQVPQQQGGAAPGAVTAGIMGVHSKSTDDSIRIYKGQTRYDQWNFVFTALNRPGGNMPGAAAPGGPGGAQTPGGRPSGGRGPGQGTGPGEGRGRAPGTGPVTTPGSRGRSGGFDFPPPPPPPSPFGGRSGRGGGF
jgi:type II secretory pathway pseudopilin PulG